MSDSLKQGDFVECVSKSNNVMGCGDKAVVMSPSETIIAYPIFKTLSPKLYGLTGRGMRKEFYESGELRKLTEQETMELLDDFSVKESLEMRFNLD